MLSREEQNNILDALNERNLPFNRYKFKWDDKHKNLVRLGGGGFGNVYACEGKVENDVAIKVIGFQIPTIKDPEEIDGCDEEVWIQREVSETCKEIVQIRDAQWLRIDFDDDLNVMNAVSLEEPEAVGEDSGLFFFILMERLDPIVSSVKKGNKILFPRLQNTNENEIIKLAIDIGKALRAAHTHSRKIIHRDVKLENVFWDKRLGVYKLGDFGIARATTDGGSMTRGSGTRLYIAPEVFLGKDYDVKADMYSFGIMLYGLLNERKLPNVETRMKEKTSLPLPKYGSEELQKIVLKTCSYKPEDRYESMDEVLKELEKLQKQDRSQKTISLEQNQTIEDRLEEVLGSITVSSKSVEKTETSAQMGLTDLFVDVTRKDAEEAVRQPAVKKETPAPQFATKKEAPAPQPAAKKAVPAQQPAVKKEIPVQQPAVKKEVLAQQPAAKKDTKELIAEVDRYLAKGKEKRSKEMSASIQKYVFSQNVKYFFKDIFGDFFWKIDNLFYRFAERHFIVAIIVQLLEPILRILLMGVVFWGSDCFMEALKMPLEWYWVGNQCCILLYLAFVRRFPGLLLFLYKKGNWMQRLCYIALMIFGTLTMIEGISWPEAMLQWELTRIGLISMIACEGYNLLRKSKVE